MTHADPAAMGGPSAMPPITVIAACYNHARFLHECLDSIAAQTLQRFQLIVTDDASRDESPALIEQWLARHRPDAIFIRNAQNRGICATLNSALARATGRYVAMVATDDVWLPHRLEAQLRAAEELPPSVAVVYSDALVMDEQGQPLGDSFLARHGRTDATGPSGQLFSELADGNFIPAMATLVRREALAAVGGYDEQLAYEDYDMWLRLAGAGYEFRFLPDKVARYRIVRSSMTNTVFIRPSAAFSRSVIQLHDRWLQSGRLTAQQRRQFASKVGGAAYNLFILDAPDAGRWLRLAARRSGETRLCLLAVARTLGLRRPWIEGLRRKLGLA